MAFIVKQPQERQHVVSTDHNQFVSIKTRHWSFLPFFHQWIIFSFWKGVMEQKGAFTVSCLMINNVRLFGFTVNRYTSCYSLLFSDKVGAQWVFATTNLECHQINQDWAFKEYNFKFRSTYIWKMVYKFIWHASSCKIIAKVNVLLRAFRNTSVCFSVAVKYASWLFKMVNLRLFFFFLQLKLL